MDMDTEKVPQPNCSLFQFGIVMYNNIRSDKSVMLGSFIIPKSTANFPVQHG